MSSPEEVKKLLSSLIISSHRDITVRNLLKDYSDIVGYDPPYRTFGFRSFEAYLASLSDICQVIGRGDNASIRPVVNDKNVHMNALVMKSRPPRNNKGKRMSTRLQAIRKEPTPNRTSTISKKNSTSNGNEKKTFLQFCQSLIDYESSPQWVKDSWNDENALRLITYNMCTKTKPTSANNPQSTNSTDNKSGVLEKKIEQNTTVITEKPSNSTCQRKKRLKKRKNLNEAHNCIDHHSDNNTNSISTSSEEQNGKKKVNFNDLRNEIHYICTRYQELDKEEIESSNRTSNGEEVMSNYNDIRNSRFDNFKVESDEDEWENEESSSETKREVKKSSPRAKITLANSTKTEQQENGVGYQERESNEAESITRIQKPPLNGKRLLDYLRELAKQQNDTNTLEKTTKQSSKGRGKGLLDLHRKIGREENDIGKDEEKHIQQSNDKVKQVAQKCPIGSGKSLLDQQRKVNNTDNHEDERNFTDNDLYDSSICKNRSDDDAKKKQTSQLSPRGRGTIFLTRQKKMDKTNNTCKIQEDENEIYSDNFKKEEQNNDKNEQLKRLGVIPKKKFSKEHNKIGKYDERNASDSEEYIEKLKDNQKLYSRTRVNDKILVDNPKEISEQSNKCLENSIKMDDKDIKEQNAQNSVLYKHFDTNDNIDKDTSKLLPVRIKLDYICNGVQLQEDEQKKMEIYEKCYPMDEWSRTRKEYIDNDKETITAVNEIKDEGTATTNEEQITKFKVNLNIPEYISTRVNERVKKNLRILIKENKKGIWCSKLTLLYKEKFNEELDPYQFEFMSISEMCENLNDIFWMWRPGKADWLLFDRNQPLPPLQSIPREWHALVFEDVLYDQLTNEKKCHPDCWNPKTDGNIDQQLISHNLEDFVDVFVTEVINPNKFYIQLVAKSTEFKRMMTELQKIYCIYYRKYRLTTTCSRGIYIAVFHNDKYHRAVLQKIYKKTSKLKVFLIDYGQTLIIPITSAYFLERQFCNLPKQAIHCSLSHIKLKSGVKYWSSCAIRRLMELTKNKPVVGTIKHKSNISYYMILTDVSDPLIDIHINDVLCDEGLAVPNYNPQYDKLKYDESEDSDESGESDDSVSDHLKL